MAILNFKNLIKNPEWKKLNASARALLMTVTTLTDKEGFGCLTNKWLMIASGITGKGTFQKARNDLVKAKLLKITKYLALIKRGKKRPPRIREYTTYGIPRIVLRKKDRDIAPTVPSTTESLGYGRRKTGIEEGILRSNEEDINTEQPSAAGKKNSFKRKKGGRLGITPEQRGRSGGVESLGVIIKRLEKLPDVKKPKIEAWQGYATFLAKKLGVKTTASWFRFFKRAYQKNKMGLLNASYRFVTDYKNPRDKTKLFYWKFGQLLEK